MADERPTLTVAERTERGSRAVRRMRRTGDVPGVLYGGGGEPVPFKVNARELRHILTDGSALIDVQVDGGKARPVIVKEQQLHPVRDELMHIDLLEVRLDVKIHAPVAVHVEGAEEAPGVKEGGVLEHVTHQLTIEALPTDIPENITVDVSDMEIAGTKTLAELTAPPGVEFLDDPETVIASVVVPTEVEEPEEEVEEETELVGEEGEEEAGAEGATGEEAEQAGEAAAEKASEGEGS